MRNSLTCRVCISVLLVASAIDATAQPNPVPDVSTITLDEAVTRSLKGNPELVALGYQLEVHKGVVLQSGLKPNPELNVQVENIFGGGRFSGIDSAETTLSISWLLERGKRQSRIDVSQSGLSGIEIMIEARRLDIAAQTARVFLENLATQERMDKFEEIVQLSRQTVIAMKQRVQAGKTSTADLARAEAQLSRDMLDRDDLNHELSVAKQKLAAQWGKSKADFAAVRGNAFELPVPVPYASLLALIEKNPDIQRYHSEQHLREAELRLAEARAKPSWRVSAGIRRFELSNHQAFVAGMSIPLASRDRNQGNIAKARANLARTDADRSVTYLRIETQLFSLYQELSHSLHRAHILREEIIPRSQLAFSDTQKAYLAGRYGYFELRVVQTELIDAQMALIDASISAHHNVIEIERLIGATPTSSINTP